MKNMLRFFAFLDLGSILLISPQIFAILTNLNTLPSEILSQIKALLSVLVFILLFLSAAGLFFLKRYGAISYYLQFPLRLIVWIFSFGFLTFLSEYFKNPLVFEWLFRLAIVLEFFRLYFTIQIHRKFL